MVANLAVIKWGRSEGVWQCETSLPGKRECAWKVTGIHGYFPTQAGGLQSASPASCRDFS